MFNPKWIIAMDGSKLHHASFPLDIEPLSS